MKEEEHYAVTIGRRERRVPHCYESFCEPFFSTQCVQHSESWTYRLVKQRNNLIRAGIRFDKSIEDKTRFLTETSDRAHVSQANGDSEWFTPLIYIEAARELMGGIEVDPASTERANEVVQAKIFYTKEQDGLKQEWKGRVWMNPPYAQPLVAEFCDLFVQKYLAGEITEGCVLVNNATETIFLQNMLVHCSALCLIRGRVRFLDVQGNPAGAPLQGQLILYFGSRPEKFVDSFGKFGVIFLAG